jgi:hypothetical protein
LEYSLRKMRVWNLVRFMTPQEMAISWKSLPALKQAEREEPDER